MNSEYLSDGFLFERAKTMQDALQKDPHRTLEAFRGARLLIEQELSKSDPKEAFAAFSSLLKECGRLLNDLIDELPRAASLFPDAPERQAALLAVLHFFSACEPQKQKERDILTALLELEKSHALLQKSLVSLRAALLPAVSASAPLSAASDLKAELCTVNALEERLRAEQEAVLAKKESLSNLHEDFFCRLFSRLSIAADMENAGKDASPAVILELCGRAKQLLFSL